MGTSAHTSTAVDRRADVVVVGGGNGGLSVAGRLRRAGIADVVVVEPRDEHHYKPLFSHVAGGTARASETIRPQAAVIPRGVTWVRDAVASAQPDESVVTLASGERLAYQHLIVAAGIRNDWDAIGGLSAAMDSDCGASNYELELAAKASTLLRDLREGTVVFVQTAGPASCAGAAQKPMYQACDYWRRTGVLERIRVIMLVPDPTVFGIPEIDAELERKIAEYGIDLRCDAHLVSVDAAGKSVGYATGPDRSTRTQPYDVLMVEPPQTAPAWITQSGLSSPAAAGFVDVDVRTLRHARYADVWSLGDAAATTNSKSGGALRKQTQVLARNLVAVRRGRAPDARYDGYGVCPFTVSRSSAVFAEFDDEGRLAPSVPLWRTSYRESRLSWLIDRHIFPHIYWRLILKGRA